MSSRKAAKELEQIVRVGWRVGDAGVDELTKLWERGRGDLQDLRREVEGVQGKIRGARTVNPKC